MSLLRSRYVFLLATIAAMGSFFACAESDGEPDRADAGSLPDTSVLPNSQPDDAASAPEAAADLEAGTCGEGGFCDVPLPVHDGLLAISAASMDDAWAISRHGILHWDGTSWKLRYQLPSFSPDLFGIWVAKHDDVWILGRGLLIRYSARDGEPPAFREYPDSIHASPRETSGFWVSPESDELWIATSGFETGSVGYRYREEPDGTLSETHLGADPILFPWIGGGGNFLVRSVFGFGPADVYVGGSWCEFDYCGFILEAALPGVIGHFDGSSWSIVAFLDTGERVSAIHGTTAADESRQLWVWSGVPGFEDNAIRLFSMTRDGGVGEALASRPVRLDIPQDPGSTFNNVVSGCHRVVGSVTSSSAAWFSDVCFVYRWSGTALEVTPTPVNGVPIGSVTGIWAGSADEAWVVGEVPGREGNAPFFDPEDPPRGFAARRVGRPR